MSDDIQPRKRVRRPKVRSGCRSCKIRRVKCDETRPRCQRCTKHGVICGGYESKFSTRSGSEPSDIGSPMASPQNLLGLSSTEAQNFDWFRLKTIQSLGGFSRSTTWEALLLQISQSEPAVLSAVVALGSTHRNYERRDGQEDLRQRSYVIAMSKLRRRLADDPNHEIALVVCFLFICLELIENNFAAVFVHLRTGLRILCELRGGSYYGASRIISTTTNPKTLIDFLAAFFVHLDYQATLYGERTPRVIGRTSENSSDSILWIPERFTTVTGVKTYIDTLVTAVSSFKARVLHDVACPNSWLWYDKSKAHRWAHIMFRNHDVRSLDASLLAEKEELEERLSAWNKAYSRFWKKNHLILDVEDTRIAKMALLAWYSMTIIIKETTATRQKFFDQYLDEFEQIISLAEELSALPSFSTDLGSLGSLYYTGIKCRDSLIRNRAAHLLLSTSRKEGMWDSQMLGKTVLKTIALEEFGLQPSAGQHLSCDDIPESSRYYEVATGGTRNLYAGRFRHEESNTVDHQGEWFVQEVEFENGNEMVTQGVAVVKSIRELGAAVFTRPFETMGLSSSPAVGGGLQSKVFRYTDVPGEAELEYLRRLHGNGKLEVMPRGNGWEEVPGIRYPRTFVFVRDRA